MRNLSIVGYNPLLVGSLLLLDSLSSCQASRYHLSRRTQTSAHYITNAKVSGIETIEEGHCTLFRYSIKETHGRVAHATRVTIIFLQAQQPETWPIGKHIVATDSMLVLSGFQFGNGRFADAFQNMVGTVTRLPSPTDTYNMRLDLRYSDSRHQHQRLKRTILFQLDSTFFQRRAE